MQVSEILRKIADLVDADETIAQPPEAQVTQAPQVVQAQPESPDGVCDDELGTMVSPLQQELELRKMDQGVDNNVAEFASDETDGYNDELAQMKKSAGIGEEPQGPHNYAEDLKPVSINPKMEAAKAFHKARKARPE